MRNRSAHTTSNAYVAGRPNETMSTPASIAPTVDEICDRELFQVTALGRRLRGNRLGTKAPRAAQPNARAQAYTPRTSSMSGTIGLKFAACFSPKRRAMKTSASFALASQGQSGTRSCQWERAASAKEQAAPIACVVMRIVLRFKRSARWPAGRAKRITGNAPTKPTKPRIVAERVRWKSSYPTDAATAARPRTETKYPMAYLR